MIKIVEQSGKLYLRFNNRIIKMEDYEPFSNGWFDFGDDPTNPEGFIFEWENLRYSLVRDIKYPKYPKYYFYDLELI